MLLFQLRLVLLLPTLAYTFALLLVSTSVVVPLLPPPDTSIQPLLLPGVSILPMLLKLLPVRLQLLLHARLHIGASAAHAASAPRRLYMDAAAAAETFYDRCSPWSF